MDAALPAGLTRPDYAALLVEPSTVEGLPPAAGFPPVPVYPQRDRLAPVPVPAARDAEPLAPVTGDRITALAAYWATGWPAAVDGVWLRQAALAALSTGVDMLPPGFGVCVLDGWRPLALQREIWAVETAAGTPDGYVSEPSTDPASPPPHLTGGAVDATLTWQGVPLALGTPFDCFSPAAAPTAYESTPGVVRDLRRMLHAGMGRAGFVGLACEWWHFEIGTARWATRTGQPAWYSAAGAPRG